jgi:aerobic-type carbon monoxide dehydrogenase small subunit (CoxS/CutS family)
MKLTCRINQTNVTVQTNPDRRVVDLLREDLGLTGTKEGCGAGECGACTILVDSIPKLSCLMLAAQLEGKEITTIEGVSGEDSLHAIQDAFVQAGAIQCGFCTPGMVLSALSLLNQHPHPDRRTIRNAMSGHICRCTGYTRIVDAIEAAAESGSSEDQP